MTYPVLLKQFSFTSPLPPDEVMKRLNDLIVTSYPYYTKDGKPYKGCINGYSFEMQKIDDGLRSDAPQRRVGYHINFRGIITPYDKGSAISVVMIPRIILVILPIFALGYMMLAIYFASRGHLQIVVTMIIFIVIAIVLKLNWFFTEFSQIKALLYLHLNGEDSSQRR